MIYKPLNFIREAECRRMSDLKMLECYIEGWWNLISFNHFPCLTFNKVAHENRAKNCILFSTKLPMRLTVSQWDEVTWKFELLHCVLKNNHAKEVIIWYFKCTFVSIVIPFFSYLRQL